MNREIKFRAWDKTINEMRHWNDGGFQTSDGRYYCDFKSVCSNPEGFNLMQYTGLKDKNGKEVYEGDILHYHNGPSRVEWHPQGWWILSFYVPEEAEEGFTFLANARYYGKVIGNVYEDPELLKEQ